MCYVLRVQIAVIDSGSGNLRSVQRALLAAGGQPSFTSDPEVVRKADRIVVPGQGAFGDCMSNLRSQGLDQAIAEFVAAGRPYFGICLGMQILLESSEESPEEAGLAILKGAVKRFAPSVGKVPHMGWNQILHAKPELLMAGIPERSYFYFTHSYYALPANEDAIALRCDYGGSFAAALRQDNIFACQFHPEKSQGAGLQLLRNFVTC